MASKYGDRVKLGRQLAEDTGTGLDSPDALIDDTVLADLIRERIRYNNEYGDNPDLPNNMLDAELKNLYLGDGILRRITPEHIDIPDDPEVDHIVDEANLAPESIFSGGPRIKKPSKDKLDTAIEDAAAAEKKRKKEEAIRAYAAKLAMRQGGDLTTEQRDIMHHDPDYKYEGDTVGAITDLVKWDQRVGKKIGDDQLKRDKSLLRKDKLARKVIAYADDPEQFMATWYKSHPVFAKRRLPNGKIEKKEQIFSDENPDPDLEGVELVKYADAMNRKFPPVSEGFIEYDYGPPTKAGNTKHPEDPLKAAATGKPFTTPEKLAFPEVINNGINPEQNRLAMVRRMLFGELTDEQLEYLMELIERDQQFSDGGFVDNAAFRFLQKRYGPNHPVLSDKRFKRYVGRLATNIRRVV